ncbi:hypothetical protein HYX14_00320 [Candidatus Woesearchaeota archaeon]|nr:hypothetical protein [Candidatus Woesearchaeota archaeon]
MTDESKGIVHFGINDVFDVQTKKQYYDHLMIIGGCGRGTYENGFAPDFQRKMKQFDLLMKEKTPIDLGNGKVEAMSPRDLKCRYDGHSLGEDVDAAYRYVSLDVRIGPTSFQEWKQDYNRSPEQAAALQSLGLEQHADKGFYLSNGLGAVVLTLTREKDVVVGVRQSDSYDGAIHGAAGWMTFNQDFSQIHPQQDAYRELQEELNVKPEEVSSLTLIGLVAYPKTLEADFVYVAQTTKEREYFSSGKWKDSVDAREHRDLVLLSNSQKIGQLVNEGKIPDSPEKKYDVLPSTKYGLNVLAEHHF